MGCGGMGSWFAEYLSYKGHSLTVSDVRHRRAEAVAEAVGAKVAASNLEAVGDIDIAPLCFPP